MDEKHEIDEERYMKIHLGAENQLKSCSKAGSYQPPSTFMVPTSQNAPESEDIALKCVSEDLDVFDWTCDDGYVKFLESEIQEAENKDVAAKPCCITNLDNFEKDAGRETKLHTPPPILDSEVSMSSSVSDNSDNMKKKEQHKNIPKEKDLYNLPHTPNMEEMMQFSTSGNAAVMEPYRPQDSLPQTDFMGSFTSSLDVSGYSAFPEGIKGKGKDNEESLPLLYESYLEKRAIESNNEAGKKRKRTAKAKEYSEPTPLTSKTARREFNVKESETEVHLPLSSCSNCKELKKENEEFKKENEEFKKENEEFKKENERLKAAFTQFNGLLNAPPGTAAFLESLAKSIQKPSSDVICSPSDEVMEISSHDEIRDTPLSLAPIVRTTESKNSSSDVVFQDGQLNVESSPRSTENKMAMGKTEDTAIWYEGKNLMNVKAPQNKPSKCATKLLDMLFKEEELQDRTLIESPRSTKQPLDAAKVEKMFEVLNEKYGRDQVEESYTAIVNSCNQKCRDTHRKMRNRTT